MRRKFVILATLIILPLNIWAESPNSKGKAIDLSKSLPQSAGRKACDPGDCRAMGQVFSCGITYCDEREDQAVSCGCDCVSINEGNYYPKAYCGQTSPFGSKSITWNPKTPAEKTANAISKKKRNKPATFKLF